ncbi:hypothetical protein [Lentilactobacillus kisonensis]|nr:hypothetical protein [Lentilactobacillus kisonensis]
MKHKKTFRHGDWPRRLIVYFLKSIGWFEDDSHLYDEYEAK